MSAIDEVKQRIDIVDIISQYTPLTKAGRNFRAICPFHNEKTPSFFVFPERQSWHCFGACNTGGDVFSFIMKKEGVEFTEALQRLAEKAGVILPSWSGPDTKKEVKERLFQINDAAARYYQDLLVSSNPGEKARNYLQYRGVNADSLTAFRLGYALESWDALKLYLKDRGFNESEQVDAGLLSTGDNGRTYDRWRHRLMFPIMDEKGRVTGFGARVLESSAEGPKYINTSQTAIFDKSATLYGLNLANPGIKRENVAVIVEGYMDVIAAHQYGFTNVVASMGTSITDRQVGSLKKLSRNLVLALDSDSAGTEAMQRCADHENTLEAEIKVVILPEGKDPDDVIKEDTETWRQLVSNATPVIDYTFNMVTAGLDLTKVSDRTKARDRLYPVVDGITDIVRRAHYLQKLAGLIGVTDTSLEASMKKKGNSVRDKSGRKSDNSPARTTGDSLFKSAVEEYCLTLLVQNPGLREQAVSLPPEYFENSENLEIFLIWRDHEGLTADGLKQIISMAIKDHLESVISKAIPPNRIEQKYGECVLRLREKYLRNLERKREAALAMEEIDTSDELAKSRQTSLELKEVFGLKARREQGFRS
jgi:DNA primase